MEEGGEEEGEEEVGDDGAKTEGEGWALRASSCLASRRLAIAGSVRGNGWCYAECMGKLLELIKVHSTSPDEAPGGKNSDAEKGSGCWDLRKKPCGDEVCPYSPVLTSVEPCAHPSSGERSGCLEQWKKSEMKEWRGDGILGSWSPQEGWCTGCVSVRMMSGPRKWETCLCVRGM